VEPELAVEAEPAPPQFRPFRFRIDYGLGFFSPTDVNNYLKSKIPSDAYVEQGFSDMVLLFQTEASFAYYPLHFLGIRPSLTYLFAPKIYSYGDSSEGFWLHSLAPGLSVDLTYDTGRLARLFLSPGISYQWGWLDSFSASGLGVTFAGGAELSFGQARSKGLYVAGVLRIANLGVNGQRYSGEVNVNHLDFTSFMICVGFQFGT